MFDADGTLAKSGSRYQLNIVGKKGIVSQYEKYLKRKISNLSTNISKRSKGCFVYPVYQDKQIREVLRLLYEDASVFLERKYMTVRNFLSK